MARKRWKVEELAEFVDPGVLDRAQGYVRSRRVTRILDEGGELVTDVQGSAYEPYRVRIVRPDSTHPDPSCDCPYGGAWCKHAVAALLVWGSRGDKVAVREPLGHVLETLTKKTLVQVIEELAAEDPSFEEAVRLGVAPVDSVAAAGSDDFEEHTRRLVHSLDHLRRSEAYWQVGRVVDRVLELVETVAGMERDGDLEAAATALEGVTRGYVEEWGVLDDSDGRCTEPLVAIGDLWTRLMLRMHRDGVNIAKRWAEDLDRWGAKTLGFEVFELSAAAEAARNGWESLMFRDDWKPKKRPEAVQGYANYVQEMVRDRLLVAAETLEDEAPAKTPEA